jgi:hypothetical protein
MIVSDGNGATGRGLAGTNGFGGQRSGINHHLEADGRGDEGLEAEALGWTLWSYF